MDLEDKGLINEYGGQASLLMVNLENSITLMSYNQFGWIDKKV